MDLSCYRKFNDKEALKWGKLYYSDWLPNIQDSNNEPNTPLEQFFRYYTRGAHNFFNNIVRHDDYMNYDFTNSFFSRQMFIDSIEEIKKHKISESIIVYRLLKEMLLLGGSKCVKKGAYLIDGGFMSTTLSLAASKGHSYANLSERYLFTIYVPKGTPCVFVDLISDMNEREMLFAPDTKLQVINSSPLKRKIECIIING